MPNYNFECKDCGFECLQEMTIEEYCKSPPILCWLCQKEMKRVYRSTAILDNCPGFYGRNKG